MKIQSFARALWGLFDAKGGKGFAELLENVQPVIDVRPNQQFPQLQLVRTTGLLQGVYNQIAAQVPAGEQWEVLAWGAMLVGAADIASLNTGSTFMLGFTPFGAANLNTVPMVSHTYGTNGVGGGGGGELGVIPPQPLILGPGASLNYFHLGPNALAVAVNAQLCAWVVKSTSGA